MSTMTHLKMTMLRLRTRMNNLWQKVQKVDVGRGCHLTINNRQQGGRVAAAAAAAESSGNMMQCVCNFIVRVCVCIAHRISHIAISHEFTNNHKS